MNCEKQIYYLQPAVLLKKLILAYLSTVATSDARYCRWLISTA